MEHCDVFFIAENTHKQKPEIADFSPNHTVVVQVGENVKFSCAAEKIKGKELMLDNIKSN